MYMKTLTIILEKAWGYTTTSRASLYMHQAV
jgi:hypothetical protein